MPFPLAHPAAVLLFRRFCPKLLSFPALVMGSLSPDAGYLLGPSSLEQISHQFPGGLCFGLVVGLGMLFGFYLLVPIAIQLSPLHLRETLLRLRQQSHNSLAVMGISVLIGTATHLLLDSFTHAQGWFVLHSSLLRKPVATIHFHEVRVCHFLWYISSFVGIAWLAMAFHRWRQLTVPGAAPLPVWARFLNGLLVATLVLPIEVAHHLVRSRLGLVLVVLLSLALAAVAIFCLARTGTKPGISSQPGQLDRS
jgi:hypothetical protein